VRASFSKVLLLVAAAVATVLVVSIAIHYINLWQADPITSNGLSMHNDETRRIYVELVNNGRHVVQLTDVTINGGKRPKLVQLVISYTGELPSFGIEDNELADYVGIHEMEIKPSLANSSADVREIIQSNISNPEHRVPIHYGLYLDSDDLIETMELRYKYLGISKTKTIMISPNWAD